MVCAGISTETRIESSFVKNGTVCVVQFNLGFDLCIWTNKLKIGEEVLTMLDNILQKSLFVLPKVVLGIIIW